ncbi:MAG TPA: hypothetical protein VFR17_03990 [Mycobacterium sp.]|nr:hypothetical protein [Mycobacterium sp.]
MNWPPPGYGPPGYPPPGYPPPGYGPPGYPRPGYPPPGYPPGYPPPGYGPPGYGPPGYGPPGYGPPGYPPPGYRPPVPAPGVIPLRPLSLADLYNGAVGYIRANPRVTLGVTAAVVVITQIITLFTRVVPRAAVNRVADDSSSPSFGQMAQWGLSLSVGALMIWLATIVLTGMLTVIVGRAVFGSSITAGEAWAMVRGRLPALIGLAVLIVVAAMTLLALTTAAVVGAAAAAGSPAAGFIVGMLLIPIVLALVVYLYVAVSLAPTAIVLERQSVFGAIRRSFALVRNSFWRVFGILALTNLITYLISGAVALPFDLAGLVAGHGATSLSTVSAAGVIARVGAAIGQIIVLPFTAGVVVLLYTDRRMRAEAFDLVLQTGAVGAAQAAGFTDNLWLIRPPA